MGSIFDKLYIKTIGLPIFYLQYTFIKNILSYNVKHQYKSENDFFISILFLIIKYKTNLKQYN